MKARTGGCHCGAVRFEVDLPDQVEAQACTCSMCEKTGFIHIIVPESRFRITQGEEAITTYTFNTGVAQHTFCSVCGVKAFYRPRSNPDGFSVWLAGGGIKGGTIVGATDHYGYKAVENRKSVYDLHATMLRLMGIDHEKLTYRHNGRDMRLTDVHGNVIDEIIA